MKAVLLCLVLVVAVSAYSADVRQAFTNFQHQYGHIYSAEEFPIRFKVFQDNLKIVEKMNQGKEVPTYGITKFMDLTPEEFKAMYLMKKPINTAAWKAAKPAPVLNNAPLPSSFDWRTRGVVTPVYNQAQCGSCWAFSITENIESMWAIAGNTLTQLSMQQVVDCDTSDDGCGGGDPPTAYQYVMSAGGLEPYADYPYTGENGYCQFNSGEVVAKISGWNYATQSGNENNMATYLVNNGPLSICVDAESWQYYNGGIIVKGDGCGTSLDHCVQAVGFNTEGSTPYWIVRNSWGTDWGMNGYLYVEMGQDVCGIAQEATCAVAA